MLYSKNAIALLSLILSPFLGTILMAYNLKAIGQTALGPAFVIGSFFLSGMVMRIAPDLNPWIRLGIINIVGSSLLYFYFWHKYFGKYEFEKKNFWPPTLRFMFVIGVIAIAMYFRYRK